MPKVSVIIPVYNVEAFLRQCLDSVIHQTLRDIEIICVDDGSTDGSYAILQEYAKCDDRVIVLQQQNAGAGAARNAGMKQAKGDYLSILDADDFFEPDMLEKAYAQCEKDKADFCVYRSDQYDMQTNEYEPMLWTIRQECLPDSIPFSAQDIAPYIFQIFNGWSWDKLYRREFIETTGLQFQGLRTTNDAFFVFMANVQAKRITIVDKVLAYHRVNVNTSLSVTREKSWNCCWEAAYAIYQELRKRKQYKFVEQSFINWALNFLLWNVYTLQGEAKEKLLLKLRKEYFRKLKFQKYPERFFYNVDEYREYLNIMDNGEKHLLRNIARYYKNNGMKATVGKIVSKVL